MLNPNSTLDPNFTSDSNFTLVADSNYSKNVVAATSFYKSLLNVTETIPNSAMLFSLLEFEPVFWLNRRLNDLSNRNSNIRFQDFEFEMIHHSVEQAFDQHLQQLSNSSEKDHVFWKIIQYLCKHLQTHIDLLIRE